MCNITASEDEDKFSCACGLAIAEEEPKQPDSFVGALYEVSGRVLSIVPPKEGCDVLSLDGKNPVRIAVLKSGELQLTSLISTNDKAESIKNSRDAHHHELKELQETLVRLSEEKSKAEKRYSNALGSIYSDDRFDDDYEKEDDDDNKTRGQEEAALLLKLVAQEYDVSQRVAKLEDTETLKVTFSIQGGMTASLQPGIVTAVPFVTNPLVWCPKSLAKAMPLDDTVDVVTVPVSAGIELDTPSRILREDMLQDLLRMLSPSVTASMTLRKLHDQTAGVDKASFDAAVRPHGNVLSVIQSESGQVFGGFFSDPMGSHSGWHKGHDDDFIFSLGSMDQDVRAPVKLLKPKDWSQANAVYLGRCGLHMGSSGYGMSDDLVAFCSDERPSHTTSVPQVYTMPAEGYPSLPAGQSIAGNPGAYTPIKMEVYQVAACSTDSLE